MHFLSTPISISFLFIIFLPKWDWNNTMIVKKIKICTYQRKHEAKKTSQIFYEEKNCKIEICYLCLDKCYKENLSKKEIKKSGSQRTIKLFCGCLKKQKQILQVLNQLCLFCECPFDNRKDIKLRCSRKVHARCEQKYEIKRKSQHRSSSTISIIRKIEESVRDKEENEIELDEMSSNEEQLLKVEEIEEAQRDEVEKQITVLNERKDLQFFDPQPFCLNIRLKQQNFPSCTTCKYPIIEDSSNSTTSDPTKSTKDLCLMCIVQTLRRFYPPQSSRIGNMNKPKSLKRDQRALERTNQPDKNKLKNSNCFANTIMDLKIQGFNLSKGSIPQHINNQIHMRRAEYMKPEKRFKEYPRKDVWQNYFENNQIIESKLNPKTKY